MPLIEQSSTSHPISSTFDSPAKEPFLEANGGAPIFAFPLDSVFDANGAHPEEFPVGFGKKPFSFINGFNSWMDANGADAGSCSCGAKAPEGLPHNIGDSILSHHNVNAANIPAFGMLRRLLARLPMASGAGPLSTVKMIQVNKDINMDTGSVKTKVDEKVYKVEPDGHLKKLFRVRISGDSASSGAAPLSQLMKGVPDDLAKAEANQPQFGMHLNSDAQNHFLKEHMKLNSEHLPIHSERMKHLPMHQNHHHTQHAANLHQNHQQQQQQHIPIHHQAHEGHKHLRSIGLRIGCFFAFAFMILLVFKLVGVVRRRYGRGKDSASMEYVKVYNQENDSLARVSSSGAVASEGISV